MKTAGPAVKVGAFVGVMLLLAVMFGMVMGNYQVSPSADFSAVFADTSGLAEGSDVRAAGVTVGRVESVSVDGDGHARVGFSVRDVVPLTTSTQAVVRYKNLTGDRYLALMPGAAAPPLVHGGTIPIAHTRPALDLDVLYGGFQPLFEALSPQEVNDLSGEIIQVLQGEGGTMEALLTDIASLTSTLAGKDAVIGDMVDRLNEALGTVNQHGAQLSTDIDQVQRLVTGLAADRSVIGDSVVRIGNLAGATADLLRQARPELTGTVTQVNRLAELLAVPSNVTKVDNFLRTLPGAYQQMLGTGSLGSFFAFYLCGVQLRLPGANGQAINTPWVTSGEERCQIP